MEEWVDLVTYNRHLQAPFDERQSELYNYQVLSAELLPWNMMNPTQGASSVYVDIWIYSLRPKNYDEQTAVTDQSIEFFYVRNGEQGLSTVTDKIHGLVLCIPRSRTEGWSAKW